jgi:hypothetical protein
MVDLLNDAVQWLTDRLHAHASRQVDYSRGSDSVAVSATVGKTVFDLDRGYGIVEHFESRDFLIRTDDLILNGSKTIPKRGDRITDDGNTYEVMSPNSEPHYRFSDPYRRLFRIHTKLVG